MPELPEVQALADFLGRRTDGLVVTGVELGSFAVLKTFTPPPDALVGAPVDGVGRHGKFLDLDCGGTHLVFHLARAGWLRWSDAMPATVLRPGKSPIALRVRFDDGSGFDLTEAGTKKGLAAYVVNRVEDVPRIASLGPDPLADEFTEEVFAALLADHRMQVKGLLRDQALIAGVGNAYSDEILHVAKLSPFAIAAKLEPEQVTRLYTALRETLAAAVATASGKPAKELKDAKRAGMRVHGRTGEVCPECGDVVREVSFADSSLQYCATCQTGGKPLADRRTSKFLK
ncbi:Fpg/Nei family DNA glycosylase [Phycicoccus sonneratiae]|uniref:Fpg/Nei family DNA glycosylase n=1 Tax=Phycicoccus sonneratiae TaxID=2807628 RepID=A0ABS2CMQ5_9MICO|nr:Fpg/Nei family DNA glycosylase [Phycicoccus sonneraticus]MBM6401162.1 Fpg/Nei family DNA glycosylase [Phycicoccus sonneraticus]